MSLFNQSVADISVDVIGQRLASRETGSRFGQEYNTSYLYYFPAVSTPLEQYNHIFCYLHFHSIVVWEFTWCGEDGWAGSQQD